MSLPVHGDPGSLSQAGGALRQLATRLRTSGRRAHDAFDEAWRGRPDRVVAAARREVDAVDAAAAAASHELDRVGSAVQAHASDLAESVAHVRSIVARADAAGLRVADGVVQQEWGVTGVADGGVTQAREQSRARLQAELDQAVVLLARRRKQLTATLVASGEVLAGHAARLRR